MKGAHNIGNVAAAFVILLAVVERHLGELSEGWYDPADAAAVVQQAIDRMERDGEIETGHR
ncbi:hypothetical protein [Streptomyces luteolus]|uniref:Uncharacterized protein n=1 Tax=Streptomyces luteolus TaxID=3043615 RepID=A0ABT6T1M8_9ACTN|nr:hypothetical protein [Streptomyces sp. B-S-A12]MDI3421762.1 hypothetical protein [Streptomyces sp. B-S-A12]